MIQLNFQSCCNQSVASNTQYWEHQPVPPSRSESIQRWLLGRPTVGESRDTMSLEFCNLYQCYDILAAGVSQPQSLQYQHLSDYQYQDCSWVPDHQTLTNMSTKSRTSEAFCHSVRTKIFILLLGSLSRPKTSMSSKMKSHKLKPESQDSGNSSLSTPTLPNSKKYSSQSHLKYWMLIL